jgi:hypothetical protein
MDVGRFLNIAGRGVLVWGMSSLQPMKTRRALPFEEMSSMTPPPVLLEVRRITRA